jgi:hypothetical protein
MLTCDRPDPGCMGRRSQGILAKGAPSKPADFDATLMLRVPLWAGPLHVMKFGPIGIAGDLDQPVPPRHDHIQALAKRCR